MARETWIALRQFRSIQATPATLAMNIAVKAARLPKRLGLAASDWDAARPT